MMITLGECLGYLEDKSSETKRDRRLMSSKLATWSVQASAQIVDIEKGGKGAYGPPHKADGDDLLINHDADLNKQMEFG